MGKYEVIYTSKLDVLESAPKTKTFDIVDKPSVSIDKKEVTFVRGTNINIFSGVSFTLEAELIVNELDGQISSFSDVGTYRVSYSARKGHLVSDTAIRVYTHYK